MDIGDLGPMGGPHKPVLFAYALLRRGRFPEEPRLRPFADYEAELAPLLMDIMGTTSLGETLSNPFWKMRDLDVWEVEGRERVELSGGDPHRARRASLRHVDVVGGVAASVDAFCTDEAAALAAADGLLAAHAARLQGWSPQSVMDRLHGLLDTDAAASDDMDESGTPTAHSDMQQLLVLLGAKVGLRSWVPTNDRNRATSSGIPLSATALRSGERLVIDTAPEQATDFVLHYARWIDVLWVEPRGSAVQAAFEVENSTSISSGFLRMCDLLTRWPNFVLPGLVVIPDERQDKALQERDRPTFAAALRSNPHARLGTLTYSAVRGSILDVESLPPFAPGTVDAVLSDVGARWAAAA